MKTSQLMLKITEILERKLKLNATGGISGKPHQWINIVVCADPWQVNPVIVTCSTLNDRESFSYSDVEGLFPLKSIYKIAEGSDLKSALCKLLDIVEKFDPSVSGNKKCPHCGK